MLFLLVALDDTSPDTAALRVAARAEHALLVGRMKASGNFRMGGHTLDDDEKITGSAMVLDFASRAEVDDYLRLEPYAVRGIWKTVTVTRINLG